MDLDYSAPPLILAVCSAILAWIGSAVIYRRWFHPLSKIPGPFWASITHWYIVKYNLFSERSHFYKKVEELHKTYGPVVRISPDEIHLADSEYYDKIYFIGSKAPSKAAYYYDSFGLKTAGFGTLSNELHRPRRAAVNPLFSRKAVLGQEALVQSKVEQLIKRMQYLLDSNQPVDLHHGYRALAVDVVTEFAFGNCYGQLDEEDFAKPFFDMTAELVPRGWLVQAFPFLLPLSEYITPGIAKHLNIALFNFLQFRERCVKEVEAIKKRIDDGYKPSGRKNIFYQLLDPNAAEGHVVPNAEDLTDEAFTILTAGADTTGHVMAIATYYVLSNPGLHQKLTLELKQAFPDSEAQLNYSQLEKLPYLTGVIKETLRLSSPIPGRLPRRIDTDGEVFNGYNVPKGTIVGMSAAMVHKDPNVFEGPDIFVPERWADAEQAKRLDKYLVAFSKGSRQCIGIHLAYAELYIALGTVFRGFETLKVFETTPEDLVFDDYIGLMKSKSARPFKVSYI